MSQLRLVGEASGTFERMKVASLLDIDSPLEVRLSKLEQYTSEYYAPRASRDPRVVVSAKDERDESGDVDNIKTLYDDWVAGLDPSSLGCVQRTSEHPSWDL
ncbi:hypothetical protein DAEQUDRAFT_763398 [Daedalea quercina L-15889]|uniref:Uncharacterized protein n=1 Tax=Daedalea quercina L-15889 TaxID=1314783 RepID=A0A165SFJ9_9APHY|nr:hypothetical protein DAEQUDRAFT_763398 [Daedalea quercina L-15889]